MSNFHPLINFSLFLQTIVRHQFSFFQRDTNATKEEEEADDDYEYEYSSEEDDDDDEDDGEEEEEEEEEEEGLSFCGKLEICVYH